MKKIISSHWICLSIYLSAMIVGVIVYPDYGVSIDEESQREIGLQAYNYIIGNNPEYVKFTFRDHSPGFEWPLILLEKILNITDYREIFLMRHIASFIIYITLMLSGYVLSYRLFSNKLLACFVYIMLIFNPLFFAHAFFNPKDTPALCMYMLSLAVAHEAFKSNKSYMFFIFGVICGYSGCVRIMNLVIAAPVLLLLFIDLVILIKLKKTNLLFPIKKGALFLLGIVITLYVSWPVFWVNPIDNLVYILESYSHYEWENDVLFNGSLVLSTKLPWTYIPVWFLITTPELVVTLGIAGALMLIFFFIRQPFQYLSTTANSVLTISFLCFLLPLMMVFINKPVLYDSWRHMFFIYAPFVVMMAFSINQLIKTKIKTLLSILCTTQVAFILYFIISNHPFQQVYFNHFVSHKKNYLYENYELDYWGVSNMHALNWLAKHTDQPVINLNRDYWQFVLRLNIDFMDVEEKQRFQTVGNMNDVDYYIEFFRTYPYKQPSAEYPNAKVVHEEYVLNSPIYRIVKMR